MEKAQDHDEGLRARAWATRLAYFELGNEVADHDRGRSVSNGATPIVRDANFVVPYSADCDEVLAWVDDLFAGYGHIAFKIPRDANGFEARLIADGYHGGIDLLEMVLEGPLDVDASSSIDVRPVHSHNDEAALTRLKHADWGDSATRTGSPAVSTADAAQLVASKLAKCPPVQYWLAAIDGVDCAFISSWEGIDGMGIVEDLFTLPSHRHRGAATALIATAVSDARVRGATDTLIGADPNDTPKDMYREIGFRPLDLDRAYWRPRTAQD